MDIDCKEALQQLLRPSYYGIINPWMGSASTRQKQDMILLKKRMEEADRPGKNPYLMADVGKIQITSNPWGRERESNVIPVTADRIQAEFLRNQSGAEQRDVRREKERQYMARYSEIPSTASVADFFQLSKTPVLEHPTMKVLTDRVRGKLKHWQVLGPERNPHEAAEMMRGLQTLAAACERLPSYSEYSATSSSKVHERLFGYSQVVPRGNRTLKSVPKLRRTPLSSSAPILLRPLLVLLHCRGLVALWVWRSLQRSCRTGGHFKARWHCSAVERLRTAAAHEKHRPLIAVAGANVHGPH